MVKPFVIDLAGIQRDGYLIDDATLSDQVRQGRWRDIVDFICRLLIHVCLRLGDVVVAFQAGVIRESENGASLPHRHTQQLSGNLFGKTNGRDGDIKILGDEPTGSLHLGKLID